MVKPRKAAVAATADAEVDHGRERQDGVDLGPPPSSTARIPCETHASEQLGDDNGRDGHLLLGQGSEGFGEGCAGTLQGDQRAGVEDQAHGS
jgi:hypothetical protein